VNVTVIVNAAPHSSNPIEPGRAARGIRAVWNARKPVGGGTRRREHRFLNAAPSLAAVGAGQAVKDILFAGRIVRLFIPYVEGVNVIVGSAWIARDVLVDHTVIARVNEAVHTIYIDGF